MFLLPMLPEFRSLSAGIPMQIPEGDPVMIKAMVLCGTCDMPAKALFLNFNLYNGYYGCTACKQRGERLPDNRHVYRFFNNIDLRTDEETEYYATEAEAQGEAVRGVKGISILSRIVLQPVTSTAIDPMHKYSGLVMKLMQIWFAEEYSEHAASMRNYIRLIDERLKAIKPPVFVERLPRSLEHLKYWKVSELKAFLFVYAIPILHDLMDPIHLNHFKLLVCALFLLNQGSVSPESVDLASALLKEFVAQYELFYGIENMTCNVHQLLHLGDFVRNLGPLWTVSCAPFENMNGILKSFVHGTRYADLQVATAASLYMNLSVFKDRDLRPNGPVQVFCENLSRRQKRLNLVPITNTVSAADKMVLLNPIPAFMRQVLETVCDRVGNVHLFKKAYFKRRLYMAQSYYRAKKTISYCVKFLQRNLTQIGIIQNFVSVSNCYCQAECQCPTTCYAIVTCYEAQNTFSTRAPHFVLPFIYECAPTNNTVAVNVENFVTQCYHIKLVDLDKIFVVEPVNNFEGDD
jgi:hypothetical protein